MIRAILLPGMDGTGELLTGFAAALAPEFDATIISYPGNVALDYAALTAYVRDLLPRDEPFALIAESFSGPVAISLAAERPVGLVRIVLCASFAKAPRPYLQTLARLLRFLPLQALPIRLAMSVLMGRWSSPDWARRVQRVVRSVDAAVTRHRLQEVGTVDVTTMLVAIDSPLLYLKGRHDRLVAVNSWHLIRDSCPRATCLELDGPHFLLQAKPQECAAAIRNSA